MYLKKQAGFSIWRLLLGITAVVVLAVGIFVTNLIWFKPFSIDLFYNRVFLQYALANPEILTQMRMLPAWVGYNDDFADSSPAQEKVMMAITKEALETLRRYDRDDQSEDQLLSTDILDYFLDDGARAEQFMYYDYPVNQLFGVQSGVPEFMAETHQINNEGEAEDYLVRLNKFDTKFAGVLEAVKLRESMEIIPPTFVVDHVLKEMRDFVATPAKENILYTSLQEKLDNLTEDKAEKLSDEQHQEFLDQTETAINDVVYPAYAELIAYFEELKPKTTTDDGVWKFPNGDAFYRQALRTFTTTDYDPNTVHDIGLREVDNILAEMRSILENEGYEVDTVGVTLQGLAEEDRFLYQDNDEGREQIVADFKGIIEEISGGIDDAFDMRPKSGVDVKRVPEFREKTAPGAYYNDPPRDGSAPGTFYINLRSVKEIPTYGMRTLAYHEAIPGHHFQIGLQAELEGVPIFRTFGLFTAYVEGWALYSEQVAAELGFQDDPYDRLGYLQAALFRAVRLVVDTGIHAKRWTREQAIDYMRETTGMPESDVVAEIERYIVIPGQACAYMIGKLKILELRDRAQSALGDKFDLRDFHRVVLENGAVPLGILDKLIDKYIEETLAG